MWNSSFQFIFNPKRSTTIIRCRRHRKLSSSILFWVNVPVGIAKRYFWEMPVFGTTRIRWEHLFQELAKNKYQVHYSSIIFFERFQKCPPSGQTHCYQYFASSYSKKVYLGSKNSSLKTLLQSQIWIQSKFSNFKKIRFFYDSVY